MNTTSWGSRRSRSTSSTARSSLSSSSARSTCAKERNTSRSRKWYQLVFPMQTTSDEIEYSQQNLWMIDESLTFHSFIDRKSVGSGMSGAVRVDLGESRN